MLKYDLLDYCSLHIPICAYTAGPIPPELGNLTSLTYLALNGNQLSGELEMKDRHPVTSGAHPPGVDTIYFVDIASLGGAW